MWWGAAAVVTRCPCPGVITWRPVTPASLCRDPRHCGGPRATTLRIPERTTKEKQKRERKGPPCNAFCTSPSSGLGSWLPLRSLSSSSWLCTREEAVAGPATNQPGLVLSFWRAGTGRAGPTSGEQSPGGSDTPGSGRPSPSAGAPESSGLSASPSASCSGSAFTRLDFATGRESGTCT